MQEKTYQKLVSLNPDRWEAIPENKALWGYIRYLQAYIEHIEGSDLDSEDCKSFVGWLNTEI